MKIKYLINFTIILAFPLFFSGSYLFAQVNAGSQAELRKQADTHFSDENFEEALVPYSRLLSLKSADPVLNYRYGVCLLLAGKEKTNAASFLETASSSPLIPTDVWYYLGKAYLVNEGFDKAVLAFQKYLDQKPRSKKQDADLWLSNARHAIDLKRSPRQMTILSEREENAQYFFNFYEADPSSGRLVPLADQFISSFDREKLKQPLMFISADKQLIVYAAYGKSSERGKEIFISRKQPNGNWSEAQNLGGSVNTLFDEDFPLLDKDGKTLYFSSKGHSSMGGLDIFKTVLDLSTGNWSEPENVGFPVNTVYDDFYFYPYSDGKTFFYSTLQNAGKGKVLIRKIELPYLSSSTVKIAGTYVPLDQRVRRDARISIMDSGGRGVIATTNTDPRTGNYELYLPPGNEYMIVVEGGGYLPHAEVFNLPEVTTADNLRQIVKLNKTKLKEELTLQNFFTTADVPTQTITRAYSPADSSSMVVLNIQNSTVYVTAPSSESRLDSSVAVSQNSAPALPQIKIEKKDKYDPTLDRQLSADEIRQRQEEDSRSLEIAYEEKAGDEILSDTISNSEIAGLAYNDAKNIQMEADNLKKQSVRIRSYAEVKDSLAADLKDAAVDAASETERKENINQAAALQLEAFDLFAQANELERLANVKQKQADDAMLDVKSIAGNDKALLAKMEKDKNKREQRISNELNAIKEEVKSASLAQTSSSHNSSLELLPSDSTDDVSANKVYQNPESASRSNDFSDSKDNSSASVAQSSSSIGSADSTIDSTAKASSAKDSEVLSTLNEEGRESVKLQNNANAANQPVSGNENKTNDASKLANGTSPPEASSPSPIQGDQQSSAAIEKTSSPAVAGSQNKSSGDAAEAGKTIASVDSTKSVSGSVTSDQRNEFSLSSKKDSIIRKEDTTATTLAAASTINSSDRASVGEKERQKSNEQNKSDVGADQKNLSGDLQNPVSNFSSSSSSDTTSASSASPRVSDSESRSLNLISSQKADSLALNSSGEKELQKVKEQEGRSSNRDEKSTPGEREKQALNFAVSSSKSASVDSSRFNISKSESTVRFSEPAKIADNSKNSSLISKENKEVNNPASVNSEPSFALGNTNVDSKDSIGSSIAVYKTTYRVKAASNETVGIAVNDQPSADTSVNVKLDQQPSTNSTAVLISSPDQNADLLTSSTTEKSADAVTSIVSKTNGADSLKSGKDEIEYNSQVEFSNAKSDSGELSSGASAVNEKVLDAEPFVADKTSNQMESKTVLSSVKTDSTATSSGADAVKETALVPEPSGFNKTSNQIESKTVLASEKMESKTISSGPSENTSFNPTASGQVIPSAKNENRSAQPSMQADLDVSIKKVDLSSDLNSAEGNKKTENGIKSQNDANDLAKRLSGENEFVNGVAKDSSAFAKNENAEQENRKNTSSIVPDDNINLTSSAQGSSSNNDEYKVQPNLSLSPSVANTSNLSGENSSIDTSNGKSSFTSNSANLSQSKSVVTSIETSNSPNQLLEKDLSSTSITVDSNKKDSLSSIPIRNSNGVSIQESGKTVVSIAENSSNELPEVNMSEVDTKEEARVAYQAYRTTGAVSRKLSAQSEEMQNRISRMKQGAERDSLIRVGNELTLESVRIWQFSQKQLRDARQIDPLIDEKVMNARVAAAQKTNTAPSSVTFAEAAQTSFSDSLSGGNVNQKTNSASSSVVSAGAADNSSSNSISREKVNSVAFSKVDLPLISDSIAADRRPTRLDSIGLNIDHPLYKEYQATKVQVTQKQVETIDVFAEAIRLNKQSTEEKQMQISLLDSAYQENDINRKASLEKNAEDYKIRSEKDALLSEQLFSEARQKTGDAKQLSSRLVELKEQMDANPVAVNEVSSSKTASTALEKNTTARSQTDAGASAKSENPSVSSKYSSLAQALQTGFSDDLKVTKSELDAEPVPSIEEVQQFARVSFGTADKPIYSDSNPIPIDKTLPEGLVFKVQIGAFRMPISPAKFKNIQPLTGESSRPGWIRYCVGLFKTFEPANMVKKEMRNVGYKDAFVVAYYNGKRISLREAYTMVSGSTDMKEVYRRQALKETALLQSLNIDPVISSLETDTDERSFYASSPKNKSAISTSRATSSADRIVYSVQVGVYRNSKVPDALRTLEPLEVASIRNGLFRFTYGVYDLYSNAVAAKKTAVSKGVSDAFIIAYKNGQRISPTVAAQVTDGNNMSERKSINAADTGRSFATSSASKAASEKISSSSETSTARLFDEIPVEKVSENGPLVYKVQIGAFRQMISYEKVIAFLSVSEKGISQITDDRGLHLFFVGNCSDLVCANALKQEAIAKGLTDAFVVAVQGGRKVPVNNDSTNR